MDESNFKERRSEIEIRERLIRVEEAAKTSAELAKVVSDKVDKLVMTSEKQKSFIGAVVLIVSSLWAILIFAKDWLVDHLK